MIYTQPSWPRCVRYNNQLSSSILSWPSLLKVSLGKQVLHPLILELDEPGGGLSLVGLINCCRLRNFMIFRVAVESFELSGDGLHLVMFVVRIEH